MTSVLRPRHSEQRHEEKRRSCAGRRYWSDAATAREPLRPPEAGRSKEGFCPRALGGSMALSIPWFQTPGLLNCEKIHLCSCKPPRLWSFVTATLRPHPWEKKKHFAVLLLHGNHYQNSSFWGIFTYTIYQGNFMSTGIVFSTWTWTSETSWERGSAGQNSSVLPDTWPTSFYLGWFLRHGWVAAYTILLFNHSKGNTNVSSI